MEVCENCLGINIVYIGNEHDKYYCKDCGFESEQCLENTERNNKLESIRTIFKKGIETKLSDSDLDKILDVINNYK